MLGSVVGTGRPAFSSELTHGVSAVMALSGRQDQIIALGLAHNIWFAPVRTRLLTGL